LFLGEVALGVLGRPREDVASGVFSCLHNRVQ